MKVKILLTSVLLAGCGSGSNDMPNPSTEVVASLETISLVEVIDETAYEPETVDIAEPDVGQGLPEAAPAAGEDLFPAQESTLSYTDDKPDMAVPSYKGSFDEELFGTRVTRISSNDAFGVSNGSARHAYSRRQAWNADETRMMIGDAIIDAETWDIQHLSIPITTARNWSNIDPDLIYGMRYKDGVLNSFATYNVETDEYTDNFIFEGYDGCKLGDGEGSLSNDDQFAAVVCESEDDGERHIIAYNAHEQRILNSVPARDGYNWASYSQSGEYLIVENKGSNIEIVRYTHDLQERTVITNDRSHGDLGVDVNGDDILAMISYDYISYVRLKDAVRVNLAISDPYDNKMGSGHLSCRNIKRPGWCYFTDRSNFRLGAVQLDIAPDSVLEEDNDGLLAHTGIAVVEHWAFHRSSSDSYSAQPKASASPSGTKLVFTSDFYGRGEINDYVVEVIR